MNTIFIRQLYCTLL